jgi:tripartite-type tricarboxylate transporter receptor subunit TctC
MKSYAFCALVALMLASVGAVSLHAAGYPEQNIIVIVPFPPRR